MTQYSIVFLAQTHQFDLYRGYTDTLFKTHIYVEVSSLLHAVLLYYCNDYKVQAKTFLQHGLVLHNTWQWQVQDTYPLL